MRNRITLDQIGDMPINEVAALPTDQLALLVDDAADALRQAKVIHDRLDEAVALRFADRAAQTRADAGKDTGTVHFEDNGFDVTVRLPKRVKWDQAGLAALVEEIRAGGEDPAQYVKTKYDVSEAAFAAWPESIRSAFAPARTVETGKAGYRIEPKPAEVA